MNEMEFFFIGYAGEKNARRKPIDISDLMTRWPDAKPTLMVNRPKEEAPYPANTTLEGTVLYWEVSDIDVVKSGFGQAQVFMHDTDGTLLGKSEVINTLIKTSLNGTEQENPPAAVETWVTKFLEAYEEVKAGYVTQNQGVENAGKVLGVGSDGKVLPVSYSGSSDGSGSEIEISDTEPTDENTELWIHPDSDEVQIPQIDDSKESDQDTWSSRKISQELSTIELTPGPKGDTPVKGTDYWTEADKAAIVNDVLAALPNASGVNF